MFSDKKGNSIVTEDYNLTFSNHNYCELFIQERYRYWKSVLGIELSIAEDSNDTLKEVETLKVLELVCEEIGVDYLHARSKSQKSEFVEARRFAINISWGRKVNKSTIGRALGIGHDTIIYHIKELTNLCKYDAIYRKQYLDLSESVMAIMNGESK